MNASCKKHIIYAKEYLETYKVLNTQPDCFKVQLCIVSKKRSATELLGLTTIKVRITIFKFDQRGLDNIRFSGKICLRSCCVTF